MKYFVTLLIALSLLVANHTAAQVNPGMDEICIVFDWPDSCWDNCIDYYYQGPLDAYVVLHNPSAAGGVHGYEFMLRNAGDTTFLPPPNYFITNYLYPPGASNAHTPPIFIVGLSTPLPSESCTLLLTIQMLVFGPDQWCFGVVPDPTPSIPGFMAYADGADPGNILPMYPCTGPYWDSSNMACINHPYCSPVLPDEKSTWGSLKALYH